MKEKSQSQQRNRNYKKGPSENNRPKKVTKIKKWQDNLNSMKMTENRISELENRSIEFTQSAQQRKNRPKNVQSFRDL